MMNLKHLKKNKPDKWWELQFNIETNFNLWFVYSELEAMLTDNTITRKKITNGKTTSTRRKKRQKIWW
jgi:hypothetical protein